MALKPFGTIVADPPWPEKSKMHIPVPTRDQPPEGAETHYPLMGYADIAALPVQRLADEHAHLYLWATQRSLASAIGIAAEWGFTYKAVLTWCKPGLGLGFHYYRHSTEFCVFAVRGNLATTSRNVGTWFKAKGEGHSVKPQSFYEMVEGESPARRLEMFARAPRTGWAVWGNEVTSHQGVAAVLRQKEGNRG